MSEETTHNFLQAVQTFSWPEPKSASYRLYHDDQGRPLFYSMESFTGTYVEVDPATYAAASHQVRVLNGKLVKLDATSGTFRLRLSEDTGTPCDPRDVCVVVSIDREHRKWKKS